MSVKPELLAPEEFVASKRSRTASGRSISSSESYEAMDDDVLKLIAQVRLLKGHLKVLEKEKQQIEKEKQQSVLLENVFRSYWDHAPRPSGLLDLLHDDVRLVKVNTFLTDALLQSPWQNKIARTSIEGSLLHRDLGMKKEHVDAMLVVLKAAQTQHVTYLEEVPFPYATEALLPDSISEITYHLTIWPIPDAVEAGLTKNIPLGFIASDITEELRALGKLGEQNQELKVAKQLAEEATAMSKSFMASVSHEIRNPIQCILGNSQLLAESTARLGASEYEMVTAVHDSAQGLYDLVTDVLDWSKIESSKLSISYTPFSLQQLVKSAFAIWKLKGEAKGLVMKLHLDNLPEVVFGDELRIKQILQNFLSNSHKFTENGSIEMRAFVEQEEERWLATFECQDTGIGISEEQRSRIFQSFSQGDGGISRQYGGTGLGMSISKSLAEMMDGRVAYESQGLGKGCTFCLQVPLGIVEYSPDPVPTALEETASLPLSSASKLLVVEDNFLNQKLLVRMLARLGYHRVDIANNGQAGYDLVKESILKKEGYDLIIMDVSMPVMDGFTATRLIRNTFPSNEQPTIIALTGNVTNDDVKNAECAGMQGFLAKPVKLQHLQKEMKRLSVS
jgi:signal transduction histidine kinase